MACLIRYYEDPHVFGILPTGGPMRGGTLITVSTL